ncbi:MAG: SUMF1/EgtB/PvdO family nonheme iron enzyme [Alphaproteobacteria bacterium]
MSRLSELGRAAALAALLASSAGTALAQDLQPWDEQAYNPRPAPGDLVLPMPCGGRMTFRPVEVEGAGWLDDTRFEVGHSDPDVAYKEDRRFAYIAGAFTDREQPARRYYYLAKYETTRLQYATFGEECPSPSRRQRLPVVDVSWFDAVEFSRRYSEWLLGNARDALPFEGELPGYLRLPTEAEWEFAARGGLRVDRAAFRQPVFPTPDGERSEYIWYQGSQSAGGRMQLVGLLRPNPVGLYDVLGNASEMVFDPFRLNRRGRLHGQAGGFISKGGDISVPISQMRTGARTEHPYFALREGLATSQSRLGFRLALTAPAIVSSQRLSEIQAEWLVLPDPDRAQLTGQREVAALATLDDVITRTADAQDLAALETVSRDLRQALTERNDARDRTLRALLSLGAFMGNKLRTDQIRLRSVDRAINVAISAIEELVIIVEGQPNAAAILADAQQQVDQMYGQRTGLEDQLGFSLSYYADMVITLASDYSDAVVRPQLDGLKVEFAARDSGYLASYAELFVGHLAEYRAQGRADTDKWLGDILR